MQLVGTDKYEFNHIDSLTGENVTYLKVTSWADGNPMSDGYVDGIVYRKINGVYYKRDTNKPINVLILGIKNDGVTRNELILANILDKLPHNLEYYWPAGTYLFGPLPAKYNAFGTPTAINLDASGAWFSGAGRGSTILRFLPGCVGIQATGGHYPRVFQIKDMTIIGPGADSLLEGIVKTSAATRADGKTNPDVGRVVGSASLDLDNYNYNGLNLWTQSHVHNVDINNFSGHNVYILGFPELRLPGIPSTVTGTITSRTINDWRFICDTPSDASKFGYGYSILINGVTTSVGGIIPGGFAGISIVGVPDVGPATVVVASQGGAVIADNSSFSGICNLDFAGASGLRIVGSDANQTTVFGCSFRENGLWGVDDASFLGSFFYGTHFSRNGRRINTFGINGIVGNNILTIGAFIQRFETARSAFYGCYTEAGNQGASVVNVRCAVVDGIQEGGLIGGYRREGNYVNKIIGGEFEVSGLGLTLNHSVIPNPVIVGSFSSTTITGQVEILFTPTDVADMAKVVVGRPFNIYYSSLNITSKQATGFTLGPLNPELPPVKASGPSESGTIIILQPPAQKGVTFQEFDDTSIGFSSGRRRVGDNEFRLLSFTNTGITVPSIDVNGVTKVVVNSFTDYLASLANTTININTEVAIKSYTGGPIAYRCYVGGTYASAPFDMKGTTMTQNGATLIADRVLDFKTGEYISFGGITYQVLQINRTATTTTFYTAPYPTFSTGAITYAPALFQPVGYGIGSITNRPATLQTYDKGWKWLNTDAGTWSTWIGTGWVNN